MNLCMHLDPPIELGARRLERLERLYMCSQPAAAVGSRSDDLRGALDVAVPLS